MSTRYQAVLDCIGFGTKSHKDLLDETGLPEQVLTDTLLTLAADGRARIEFRALPYGWRLTYAELARRLRDKYEIGVPTFDIAALPLPVIHQDFTFNRKEISYKIAADAHIPKFPSFGFIKHDTT